MRRAREHGCLISFDVNYRQALWPIGETPAPHILKAAGMADIVKFSREELEALFGEVAELSSDLLAEKVRPLATGWQCRETSRRHWHLQYVAAHILPCTTEHLMLCLQLTGYSTLCRKLPEFHVPAVFASAILDYS